MELNWLTLMSGILSICGDPGGAAAVAPVVRMLRERTEVHAFCYRQARDVFERQKLPFLDLIENYEAISQIVKIYAPDFLLLGTSVNGGDWELDALKATAGVSSLAVLDFWSNYSARFTHRSGRMIFPDHIAVMDEQARQEMIAEGFPAGRLIVTGQPAFDRLAKTQSSFSKSYDKPFPMSEMISTRQYRVVFISQPIIPGCEGRMFSKENVLPELVCALESINRNTGNDISLIIRPHPREKDDDFSWVKSRQIALCVERGGDPWEHVAACDLVVGMDSVLLLEACALGCVVASIQLDGGEQDCLPTNRMGLSTRITDRRKLESTIHKLLFNSSHRMEIKNRCSEWRLNSDATNRVVDLIMLTLKGI